MFQPMWATLLSITLILGTIVAIANGEQNVNVQPQTPNVDANRTIIDLQPLNENKRVANKTVRKNKRVANKTVRKARRDRRYPSSTQVASSINETAEVLLHRIIDSAEILLDRIVGSVQVHSNVNANLNIDFQPLNDSMEEMEWEYSVRLKVIKKIIRDNWICVLVDGDQYPHLFTPSAQVASSINETVEILLHRIIGMNCSSQATSAARRMHDILLGQRSKMWRMFHDIFNVDASVMAEFYSLWEGCRDDIMNTELEPLDMALRAIKSLSYNGVHLLNTGDG